MTEPSRAQSLLSALLNPKLPPDINLLDEQSGVKLTDDAVVALLTQEVLQRPRQAHQGRDAFIEALGETLRAERRRACQEAASDPHMFFQFEEVRTWIAAINIRKTSTRFPRAAVQNENVMGRRLCWLLLNLFLARGSAWMREVIALFVSGALVLLLTSKTSGPLATLMTSKRCLTWVGCVIVVSCSKSTLAKSKLEEGWTAV